MTSQPQENPNPSASKKDVLDSLNPEHTYKLERVGFVEMVQNLLKGMIAAYPTDPEMVQVIRLLVNRIETTSTLGEMMSLKTEVLAASQKTSQTIQTLFEEIHSLHERYHSLEARFFDFRSKVVVDEVTETFSRDVFDSKLDQMIQQFKKEPYPLFLALITLDDFSVIKRKLNARESGQLLRSAASRIKSGVRDSDPIYRFKGSQFSALFQNVPYKTAPIIGDRICRKVSGAPIQLHPDAPSETNPQLKITASIGFAQFKEGDNAETFISRAQTACERAHSNGGNQTALS